MKKILSSTKIKLHFGLVKEQREEKWALARVLKIYTVLFISRCTSTLCPKSYYQSNYLVLHFLKKNRIIIYPFTFFLRFFMLLLR